MISNPSRTRDPPVGDRLVDAAAEPCAIGELVVGRRRHADGLRVADQPRDRGARLLAGELHETEQGVGGGVPGADDGGVPAGEPRAIAPEDVRKGRGDRVGDLGHARAARARWRRASWARGRSPRRRSPRGPAMSSTSPAAVRMRTANGVAARPRVRVRSMPSRVTPTTATPSRMRAAISSTSASGATYFSTSSAPVGARSGSGSGPAALLEQASGRRVDEVLPRREEPGVPPCPDARSDLVAGLEDDEVDAPLDQVGCGGQPDRAGADDRDRKGREAVGGRRREVSGRAGSQHPPTDIDQLRCLILHRSIDVCQYRLLSMHDHDARGDRRHRRRLLHAPRRASR